jgi:hypothetical protein
MLQPPSPNELADLLGYVVSVLEQLDIPYMVVGGFAAITYGEPRLTLDVDIVVDMRYNHVDPFVAAFPIPDYYVSREGILDSLARRYPFNVIQPHTGAKVDLVPLSEDIRSRVTFTRRQRIVYDEVRPGRLLRYCGGHRCGQAPRSPEDRLGKALARRAGDRGDAVGSAEP